MVDLYRVGEPTIGETYLNSFSASRGSGGLGTGVYAFITREAAADNIERVSPDRELYVLHNAVESPIRPQTREGTDELVRLSRKADLMARNIEQGLLTLAEYNASPSAYGASLGRHTTAEEGLERGRPLTREAFTALLHTPELRDVYGFDEPEVARDFVAGALEGRRECEGSFPDRCIQPINRALNDRFDGVAPPAGAGGATGRHGCVVWKGRVDACLGRETKANETVSAAALNDCFHDGETNHA